MTIEHDVLITAIEREGLSLFEAYEELAKAALAEYEESINNLPKEHMLIWERRAERVQVRFETRMERLNAAYNLLLAKELEPQ
jgi:hypothetical protein